MTELSPAEKTRALMDTIWRWYPYSGLPHTETSMAYLGSDPQLKLSEQFFRDAKIALEHFDQAMELLQEIKVWTDQNKALPLPHRLLRGLKTVLGTALEMVSDKINSEAGQRRRHEELMVSDPEYRKRYEATTYQKDQRLWVSLEVVDQYATSVLLESLIRENGPLVAGCRVHSIHFADVCQKYENLKAKLKQLIEEETYGSNSG
jgi:hypothetical protein